MKPEGLFIEKMETGIPGFDGITKGGLPKGRITLVAGTAGSAKTVFGTQFLAEGIIQFKQAGVFVTFEESPADIRKNMRGFGWDITQWEKDGQWAFVDASRIMGEHETVAGDYDFGALLARIEHAIKRVGAKRLTMDSIGAVFGQFCDVDKVRNELFRIATGIRKMGVTSILTAERADEYGSVARFDVEEFVADNVVILRNVLGEERRRRTVEILKFRGTDHQKGEYPFTLLPDEGLIVIPLSTIELAQKSSTIRVSSGNDTLDNMCGGGFFRDSVILASGATGAGKTLLVTGFMAGGAKMKERSLLFAFEESHDQMVRNAVGWGADFETMEKDGLLKIKATYPETQSLEDHLVAMKKVVEEFRPTRLALDSLSALERVSTMRSFREFIIGLTSFLKHMEVASLFTSTTPSLMGGQSITEAHISTLTDTILLLRYVELYGEISRGLTVLKMRGSAHDKEIREFSIDSSGMHIGKPFRNITGILGGSPSHMQGGDNIAARLGEAFQDPAAR